MVVLPQKSLFNVNEVLAFARSDSYRMTMHFFNNVGDPDLRQDRNPLIMTLALPPVIPGLPPVIPGLTRNGLNYLYNSATARSFVSDHQ